MTSNEKVHYMLARWPESLRRWAPYYRYYRGFSNAQSQRMEQGR